MVLGIYICKDLHVYVYLRDIVSDVYRLEGVFCINKSSLEFVVLLVRVSFR